jgi:hypothetical protein
MSSFHLDLIFVLFFLYSIASSFVLFRSILFSQSEFIYLQLSSSMSFVFNIRTEHRVDGGGKDADSRFNYLFWSYLTPILVANSKYHLKLRLLANCDLRNSEWKRS